MTDLVETPPESGLYLVVAASPSPPASSTVDNRIDYSDISSDEDLARRVLVRARKIAPGIDDLDAEARRDAIAILRGVVAEIPPAGSRRVRSKSRNGTSISYTDIGGAFSDDDITALRSLSPATTAPGGPIGSFPEARPLRHVWPEERYS